MIFISPKIQESKVQRSQRKSEEKTVKGMSQDFPNNGFGTKEVFLWRGYVHFTKLVRLYIWQEIQQTD